MPFLLIRWWPTWLNWGGLTMRSTPLNWRRYCLRRRVFFSLILPSVFGWAGLADRSGRHWRAKRLLAYLFHATSNTPYGDICGGCIGGSDGDFCGDGDHGSDGDDH